MDRKQASRSAKGDPKDAKNAYQGPPESLRDAQGGYSRRPWASPKDQRSLKKAAMLSTNCKLQTGDWILDAEGLTRRRYGEFLPAVFLQAPQGRTEERGRGTNNIVRHEMETERAPKPK